MLRTFKYSPLLAALLLAACTTVPTAPTVAVMPGSGKSFEQFNDDDVVCRQFAYNQNAGAAQAGRLIRVPLPIAGSADTQVKRAVQKALAEMPQGGPRPTLDGTRRR